MPSLAVVPRCIPVGSCTAPALIVALAATVGASSLGAQAPTFGTDINAAAETARDRAPLFFGSALVAPKGYFGVSLLGTGGNGERTLPMPGGPGTQYGRAWTSTLSAVWGASSRLTLGAQLGVGRTTREIEWSEPVSVGGAPAARRSEGSEWSRMEARLHGRYQLLERADGATRVALNASLAWADEDVGYATAGLAVAQRIGRVSLHLAPELRLRESVPARTVTFDGQAPFEFAGRRALAFDVRGAAVVPITRRVSWSLEGIGTNVAAPAQGYDPRLFELGTGFRFDLGRVKLDLGYRQRLWGEDTWEGVAKRRLVLGTHWTF